MSEQPPPEIETDPPMTAGQIRAAMADVPDDAPVFAGCVGSGRDLAIVTVLPTPMIPWTDYASEDVDTVVDGVEFVIDEPSRPDPAPGTLTAQVAERLRLRCHRPDCSAAAHTADAIVAVGVFSEWLLGHADDDRYLSGTLQGLAKEARNGPQ